MKPKGKIKNKKETNSKGITLVALVITIEGVQIGTSFFVLKII